MRPFYIVSSFALILALTGFAHMASAAGTSAEMSVSVRVLEIPGVSSTAPSTVTAPSTGTFSTPPGNLPQARGGHGFTPPEQYRYVSLSGKPLTNRDGVFP